MSRVPPTLGGKGARVWRGPIPGTHEPGFVERPILERELPREIRHGVLSGARELHAFTMGECNLLLGHEPAGVNGEVRWHLTISTPHRHPTWDEIKTARYRLLGPDTVVAMLLPPVADYVNVAAQDHVFQLWEIEDDARIWHA
jgi:hypothetical protein